MFVGVFGDTNFVPVSPKLASAGGGVVTLTVFPRCSDLHLEHSKYSDRTGFDEQSELLLLPLPSSSSSSCLFESVAVPDGTACQLALTALAPLLALFRALLAPLLAARAPPAP